MTEKRCLNVFRTAITSTSTTSLSTSTKRSQNQRMDYSGRVRD